MVELGERPSADSVLEQREAYSNRGEGFPSPQAASSVLLNLGQLVQSGEVDAITPYATGFDPLDRYLGGGLRPGDLVLVGGAQGAGKTTMTLQMARNLAAESGTACGYVCYEHDEGLLLQRLISLESLIGLGKPDPDAIPIIYLRDALLQAGQLSTSAGGVSLERVLAAHPAAIAALRRISDYGKKLYLLKGSLSATDVPALRNFVREWKDQHGPRVALFVDYLQKVPVFPPITREVERVTKVADSLKEIALAEEIPVVCVVAADLEGLKAQRLRIHHLRGSSSLMYESDIVLIMNNKYKIVAKHNITYNLHRAEEFKNWVVLTLEKNRSGINLLDLEFRSMFAYAGFDPRGAQVAEQLVNERIDEE